jgi:hypothetical protein
MNPLDEIREHELKIQELRNSLPKYLLIYINYKDEDCTELGDVIFDITQKQFWENRFMGDHFLTNLKVGQYIYADTGSVIVRIK